MRRKLFWFDLQRHHRLQRYPIVRNYIEDQYNYLKSYRFRRSDILTAYESCLIENLPHKNNLVKEDLDEWIRKSSNHFSSAHELFVVDGMKWGRQLTNNLNLSVTEISKQLIFTQLLLDTLKEDIEDREDREDKNDEKSTSNSINMNQFCRHLAEDVDALTKEKFGACPVIQIEGELYLQDIRPSLLHFSLVELLKNSIFAVIKKFGVLDLDDAKPIVIKLENNSSSSLPSSSIQRITITDSGIGMNENELKNCFQAFYTTTPFNSNPTYQYSRDFGVPYSGAGFGMLKSQLYLEFHEATIFLTSQPGNGTSVIINFRPQSFSKLS